MRLLVLATTAALLLAGCASLMPEPVEDPEPNMTIMHHPGRVTIMDEPQVPELPQGTTDTMDAIGTFLVDDADTFHGRYMLNATPDGLMCAVEAGPDTQALAYLNVCRVTRDGLLIAHAESTDREFEIELLDAIPTDRFQWEVQVFIEVPDGNTTGWTLHDQIRRPQSAEPEAFTTATGQTHAEVCDDGTGGLVGLGVHTTGHNGRPFVEIELQGHDVLEVDMDAGWSVANDTLRVTGDWSHDPSLNGTVWLGIQGPETGQPQLAAACTALSFGPQAFRLPFHFGVEGIDGMDWAGDTGAVEGVVWRQVL